MGNKQHLLRRLLLALLLFCLAGSSAWAGGVQTRITLYRRGEIVSVACSATAPFSRLEDLRGGETVSGEIITANQSRTGVYALYWTGGAALPANIELTVQTDDRVLYRGPAHGEVINLPTECEDVLAQDRQGVFLGVYQKGEGAVLHWQATAAEQLPMGMGERKEPPVSSAGTEFYLVKW